MVLITYSQKSFHMDNILQRELVKMRDQVLIHNDMGIILIDGRPGSGKSTLAAQIAFVLTEGKFTVDYESFNQKQTFDIMKKMQEGDCCIIDESFDVINKRTSQTSANMLTINMLQQMRSRKVFILILLPSFYDLDKNVSLWLASALLHCYRSPEPLGRRGQYVAYNIKGIQRLWLYGRQSYSYSLKIVKPNFRARFTKYFPIDYRKYENMKRKALTEEPKEKTETNRYYQQRNILIKELKDNGVSVPDISKKIGLRDRSIYDALKTVTSPQSQ